MLRWFDTESNNLFSSGEFSLYDHVLDHSAAFNVIPPRYNGQGLSDLDIYFAMGRGRQADGVDVPASEMKKWQVFPLILITFALILLDQV